MAAKDPADDTSLKRLGGGRWQTRDERFTIEPQSGTWVVVDAEQADDFGLPLVRGPFPSLTAAKAAIGGARVDAPATSPLAGRVAKPAGSKARKPARRDRDAKPDLTVVPDPVPEPVAPKPPEPPAEPTWIADLSAAERGKARRLIATLTEAGIGDAEGIVRRDLVGGVAALAAVAIARRLETLGDDARPPAVAAALADGRDDQLGVRWRLVDGDGRPIVIDAPASKRSR
jgi:hypothetical protein